MKVLKEQKIAVLYGGDSAERDVSLNSGEAVLNALKSKGYNVVGIDTKGINLSEVLITQKIERVFNILHGRGGEDGTLQGLLELLKIPYTGCGVLASSLTMDKMRTKMLWKGFGLPVADMQIVTKRSIQDLDVQAVITSLGLPLMVKPSLEGSSVGLTKVKHIHDLLPAIEYAFNYDDTVLIEKWLDGEEFSVPVLGDKVLPAVRIKPAAEFYDYHAKYISDETQYFCPAGLSQERENELRDLVKLAYDVTGCRGWGRVDVMADSQGKFYLVEVNTAPGMTSHSLVPMAAKVEGYEFTSLVEHILELSF